MNKQVLHTCLFSVAERVFTLVQKKKKKERKSKKKKFEHFYACSKEKYHTLLLYMFSLLYMLSLINGKTFTLIMFITGCYAEGTIDQCGVEGIMQ